MAQRLLHKPPTLWRQPLAHLAILSAIVLSGSVLSGCSPKVEVVAPQEPITINLNVKIEHEILVKIDKEIDEIFDENSDLF